MDPNLLRHIDYFAVPNNQTVNPVDQNASLTTATTTATATTATGEQPPIWDTSSLPSEATSAGMTFGSASRPQNPYVPKTVLPTREPPQRSREGHERKRSKLGTDAATPFDSVDYWVNFENEEGANGPGRQDFSNRKDKGAAGKRSRNAANPLATPTGSGIAPENSLVLSGGMKADPDDGIDDSALDNALSDDEEAIAMSLADHLSKIDSAPPADVPPREGLYSTPLSWEKPQPGLRMDPLLSLHNDNTLNEADQQRLIAIAMNPGPTTGGLGSDIASTFGPHFGAHAYLGAQMGAPTTTMSQIQNIPSQAGSQTTLGRNVDPQKNQEGPENAAKLSGSEKGKEKPPKGDRTAHNDIERKYRTNLKDKIAELRDAVPALRPIPENGVAEDADAASQPARAPKVSKGTVLTKATEYIHWLERRNKAIMREHAELSRRLQAFEQLLNATTRQPYTMPNYSRTLFDPRGFC